MRRKHLRWHRGNLLDRPFIWLVILGFTTAIVQLIMGVLS